MKKFKIKKSEIIIYILSMIAIIVLDQFTKHLAHMHLSLNVRNPIIPGFFNLTYLHNNGAAWGMFAGQINMFYVISLVATIVIVCYFVQSKPYQWIGRYGLVLVFTGMVGNLIDRFMFNYVRDFLDFFIFGYDYPVFNVADIAICIGVGLIVLEICIEEYKTWKISKSL